MAIIDCVMWNPQGSEITYAYKFPNDNLSTYTQLVVNESQVALLFSKGQLMGKFGPGKHTLSTENLPILRSLYGFPFGGKNPFTAQVWFVNLVETFNIPYHVGQLPMHDPDYQTQLPLAVEGQYGLKVVEPEKFLIRMVGTRNVFTQRDLTAQFTGEFTTKVKSMILQFMIQNHVGYKQISAFLDPLSTQLRDQLNQFWEEMGLQLPKFYVSTIDIDTSTPEGRRIKESIAQQASMSITGHTWQQEQMFGTANNAIGQMGGGFGGGSNGGGLLGGLMAINMMNNMSGGMGGGAAMNPQYNQPTFGPGQGGQQGGFGGQQGGFGGQQGQQQAVHMVYCSKCSRKFPSNMEFCPNCGNKYNPCPNCGADNPAEARRCVSCGTQLAGPGRTCAHCHTPIPAGSTFCPSCGQPVIAESNTCSRCGATIPPGSKFCPRCGNKR
ncbi:MAG: SPFH domain-containing protein [Muribaculaceae bacterium]|nr:SPFH domain-containing protein [Muribaculaceae bacterium]